MTDKVQKIKDWISKEQDGLMDAQGNFEYPEHEGAYHILCNLDTYIDSLQEEPTIPDIVDEHYWEMLGEEPQEHVSDDFEKALTEMIANAQKCVVEPIVVAQQWKDYLVHLAKSEEPVSEEWIKELRTKLDSMSKEDFKKVFDKYAVDFNEEPISEELEKIVEEITEPTVLNAYGTKELARKLRNTVIYGTSVSKELDEVAELYTLDDSVKPWRNLTKEAFKAGAKWQKLQDMGITNKAQDVVTNLLSSADNPLDAYATEVAFIMLPATLKESYHQTNRDRIGDAVRLGANWQRKKFEKDYTNLCNGIAIAKGLAVAMAYDKGMADVREQMMANSADAMIGLPYENKDGGYTHLVDVSRPLPVGNNKIAIIFKEE